MNTTNEESTQPHTEECSSKESQETILPLLSPKASSSENNEKDHHATILLHKDEKLNENQHVDHYPNTTTQKHHLPKYIHQELHHAFHEETSTTDFTSTGDEVTDHSFGASNHTEEGTINKIEEVAERFAHATKKKSKKALKLITVTPFNVFKEIMEEEEQEEDEQPSEPQRQSHSRTGSREDINTEQEIDSHHEMHEAVTQHTEEQQDKLIEHDSISESHDHAHDATPKNPHNQEDSGKPIKFQTQFCLCTFDETPDFLRNNPYIRGHYRKYFSLKLCLQSIFKFHNETVNIWTHLVPIFGFLALVFYTIYFMVIVHNTGANAQNILDMFIIMIYLGMAINCFFCSTMYHTLSCHSKKIWSISYRCDISAISGLIGSSIIPALYFNLYCYVGWQIVYISSIGLFAIVGMIFPCLPFKSPRALKIFRIVRTVLFISMVLSAIIPISHFLLFILPLKQEYTGGFHSEFNQEFFIGIIITVSLYGIGLLFWLTKMPERLFPGKFDLFLSSHNIWHAFIIAASSLWYSYCLNLYKVKVEKLKAGLTCPADSF